MIVRKTYIDVIKGVAMLLVVMHHCGMVKDRGMEMLTMIDVPLFFLCSGFLAYNKAPDYSRELRKKTSGILLPFILAMLLMSGIRQINPLDIFAYDITKSGYWFLEALFLIFIIWYGISASFKSFKIKLLIAFAVEILMLPAAKFLPDIINDIFVVPSLVRYFPCFMIGIILRKEGEEILKNKSVGFLLLVFGIIGFSNYVESTELNFILCIIAYICWAVLFFYFIKETEILLPPLIHKSLCIIGKYSLNVYIIHFFLIPHAPNLDSYSFLFDFLYSLSLAVIITFISLLIGKFLTLTTPLNKILR